MLRLPSTGSALRHGSSAGTSAVTVSLVPTLNPSGLSNTKPAENPYVAHLKAKRRVLTAISARDQGRLAFQ